MTPLNGLVGIVFNFPAIVASTSLSSQRAVLIHQFDDRRRSDQPAAATGHRTPVSSCACGLETMSKRGLDL
jgi:hypothetical protein